MGWVVQGWYDDPTRRHRQRWFSAGEPTGLVRDGQVEGHDPMDEAEWQHLKRLAPLDEAEQKHLWEISLPEPEPESPRLEPSDRQPAWMTLAMTVIALGVWLMWMMVLTAH